MSAGVSPPARGLRPGTPFGAIPPNPTVGPLPLTRPRVATPFRSPCPSGFTRRRAFGGTDGLKTVIRAGKQAFAGTDAPKPRVRTGKRAFGGTEVGKVAVRAGKTAFGGTEDAQTVGGAVEL